MLVGGGGGGCKSILREVALGLVDRLGDRWEPRNFEVGVDCTWVDVCDSMSAFDWHRYACSCRLGNGIAVTRRSLLQRNHGGDRGWQRLRLHILHMA